MHMATPQVLVAGNPGADLTLQDRHGPSGGSGSSLATLPDDPSSNAENDVEGRHEPEEGPGTQPKEDKKDPNLIEWDGPDDPENPRNWPQSKKWLTTIVVGIMTICVTFASSVFSTATPDTAKEFGVSLEVMTLGTSLFVLGFAFGPMIFGPFSELYGRKWPLMIGYFIFAIFQIPVAVARNLQTIFLCRFVGGLFASAPLAIVGGQLTDIFDPVNRGIAIAVFAASTFIGPVAGPVVGGFIAISYLGWRWTEYITAIMAFFFGAIGVFLVPETQEDILLKARARKIRFETKNWAIHSKLDEQPKDLKQIAQKYLFRPIKMFMLEPVLVLMTLYMGFIYGFLYLSFEAYPIAFGVVRGWNEGVGELPFISITCGVLAGCGILVWYTKTRFQRTMQRVGHVVPEERLIPMMLGGILLPGGMFWFAWTSNQHLSWVPEVISGGFLGCGVLLIFMQGLNYIIDVYTIYSNSAIAANSLFRSALGAGFPMFAIGMFKKLGVPWAMTLLGFLTSIMLPVPILFYIYGKKIRGWSRFSIHHT